MKGKDKCKILKEIRRQIAQENDIEWVVSECSHKGDCRGTCPKCESEVRELEMKLDLRRKIGKSVAIAGVSAACIAGLSACTMQDVVDKGQEIIEHFSQVLSGKPGTEICTEIEDLSGYIDIEEPTSSEDEMILDGEVAPYYDYESEAAG